MKKCVLLILYLFWGTSSICQTSFLVLDSISRQPIPYANVWVINKDIGGTTNESGKLTLDSLDSEDCLLFSAVGYHFKHVPVSPVNTQVLLNPQKSLLEEVTILETSLDKPLMLGGFKKSEIKKHSFGQPQFPYILARYFPGENYARQKVVLLEIRVPTESKIAGAKMNLRIYDKDSSGTPGQLLHQEPISFEVKKGFAINKLELSKYKIVLPPEGFFVAFEWLIIESNKYYYDLLDPETNEIKRKAHLTYQPKISMIPKADTTLTFKYARGSWDRATKKIHLDHGMIIGIPAMEAYVKKE